MVRGDLTVVLLAGLLVRAASGAELVQLDPFAQATAGFPACPAVQPRLLTLEESRTEAHARIERGTRCALEGTCEPGAALRPREVASGEEAVQEPLAVIDPVAVIAVDPHGFARRRIGDEVIAAHVGAVPPAGLDAFGSVA